MNFETLRADLESQPITGYLRDGYRLNIPLISHVEDNLYVGGCIQGVDLGSFFTHVFSLYRWERYTIDPETVLVEVTMYDAPGQVDVETIEELVPQVSEALDAGGNVLVHCQAGINRSNLLAASVLVHRGRTPAEAVALLRERRCERILANEDFYNHVMGL